jgi:soluble lytic murein transglycosylase-like protein
MRAFLGFAVLTFGVSGIFTASAQQPATVLDAQAVVRASKGDRLVASRLEESTDRAQPVEEASITLVADSEGDVAASADEETAQVDIANSAQPEGEAGLVHRIPLDEFCDVLISSARANGLPIVFFTNLIWQESRFNPNSISRAGALGVAQFMPETAAANGLENPFNPFQAVPASARLLRQLQEQFGNVGLAAAAYNAGPGRVSKWLSKRGSLPRETRAYVNIITGRPAEQWRGTGAHMAFRPARDLPCSQTPAFAELNAEIQEAAAESAHAEVPLPKNRPVRLFATRGKPASSETASVVTIKGSKVSIKGANKPQRRLAARGSIKITSKTVQLTLVTPEPGQTATHRKNAAASHDKGRKVRRLRLASTTP